MSQKFLTQVLLTSHMSPIFISRKSHLTKLEGFLYQIKCYINRLCQRVCGWFPMERNILGSDLAGPEPSVYHQVCCDGLRNASKLQSEKVL